MEDEILVVDDIAVEQVDPNNAIYDAEDNLVKYHDSANSKMYVRKGSEFDKPADPDKTEDSAPTPDDKTPPSNPEPPAVPAGGTDPKTEGPKPVEYLNAADQILKLTGYTKDEISLGEDNVVKIADLTPEQQLEIITSEFEKFKTDSDTKIKTASEKVPEVKFENKLAQQAYDFLKNNGDPIKMAKELLSKDPAAQAKMMSDVDVVKAQLKKDFPDWTDEDVADELKDMSEDKVARRAKSYRSRMEKEGPSLDALTTEQQAEKVLADQKAAEDFQQEVEKIVNTSKEIKSIAGLDLDDPMREHLLSKVTSKNKDEDSAFIQSINSPDKLIKLAFWDEFGEKYVQQVADYYFNKGKEEGGSVPAGSEEPVRVYSSQKFVKQGTQKSATKIEDLDMNRMLGTDKF